MKKIKVNENFLVFFKKSRKRWRQQTILQNCNYNRGATNSPIQRLERTRSTVSKFRYHTEQSSKKSKSFSSLVNLPPNFLQTILLFLFLGFFIQYIYEC